MAASWPLSFVARDEHEPLRPHEETGHETGNLRYIIAFDALLITALVLLVAVLITALASPRIRRLRTWYSFILSFIVLAASNLLLLTRQMGPPPHQELCTAQAVLVYAAPVWTASSGVAFLLQIFLHAYYYIRRCNTKSLDSILYHLVPFLLYVGIIVEASVLSTKYPGTTVRERNGLYCHSMLALPSRITGAVSAAGTILILILGASTAIMLYRFWSEFKRLRIRTGGGVSITLLIRIAIFSLVSIIVVGIGSSKFVEVGWNEGPVHIVTASVPLAAALTLGLQGDILRVWMFWRPYRAPEPTFDMQNSTSQRSRHRETMSQYDNYPHHEILPPSPALAKRETYDEYDYGIEYVPPSPALTTPRSSARISTMYSNSPRESMLLYGSPKSVGTAI